jgi:hypothetical protein
MNKWRSHAHATAVLLLEAFCAALTEIIAPRNVHWYDAVCAGMRCYVGKDSITAGDHPDHCWPGAPLYVTLYLVFK